MVICDIETLTFLYRLYFMGSCKKNIFYLIIHSSLCSTFSSFSRVSISHVSFTFNDLKSAQKGFFFSFTFFACAFGNIIDVLSPFYLYFCIHILHIYNKP